MDKTKSSQIRSFIKDTVIILLIVSLIRTVVFELFFVPTGSMIPTILEHELIFATKYNYGFSKYSFWPLPLPIFKGRIFSKEPERGDIVIFRPPHDLDTRYIKRVIGLPGDSVQLISGILYINGKAVKRENDGYYTSDKGRRYKRYNEILPNNVNYSVIEIASDIKYLPIVPRTTHIYNVPKGHVFFLGDNRDESGDSRVSAGYVPIENIIGKARFVILSFKEDFCLSELNIFEYFSDHIKHFFKWATSFRLKRIFHGI